MIVGKGLSRVKNKEKGAAMVEFSIVVVLFLTMLFAIFDLAVMGWVNLTMQHAVREGARYAITGRTDLDPTDSDDRYQAVLQNIKNNSMGLYDSLSPNLTISRVTSGSTEDIGESFGEPTDILLIQIDCTWAVLTYLLQPFFPGGNFNFTVSSTMRNENF